MVQQRAGACQDDIPRRDMPGAGPELKRSSRFAQVNNAVNTCVEKCTSNITASNRHHFTLIVDH